MVQVYHVINSVYYLTSGGIGVEEVGGGDGLVHQLRVLFQHQLLGVSKSRVTSSCGVGKMGSTKTQS